MTSFDATIKPLLQTKLDMQLDYVDPKYVDEQLRIANKQTAFKKYVCELENVATDRVKINR